MFSGRYTKSLKVFSGSYNPWRSRTLGGANCYPDMYIHISHKIDPCMSIVCRDLGNVNGIIKSGNDGIRKVQCGHGILD
jgi:hypothetical protein